MEVLREVLVCCSLKKKALNISSNFTSTSSFRERIQFNFLAIFKTNQQAKMLRLMAAKMKHTCSFRIQNQNTKLVNNWQSLNLILTFTITCFVFFLNYPSWHFHMFVLKIFFQLLCCCLLIMEDKSQANLAAIYQWWALIHYPHDILLLGTYHQHQFKNSIC